MDLDSPMKARWTNPDTGLIVKHPYERSHHSGAGNCWCGRWDTHPLHIGAPEPEPKPQHRGLDAVQEAIRRARGDASAPQVPIRFVCRTPEDETP